MEKKQELSLDQMAGSPAGCCSLSGKPADEDANDPEGKRK